MAIEIEQNTIRAEFWGLDASEPVTAQIEIETDEYDDSRVALNTFVDGKGSVTSYYFDREAAIRLARDLMQAVAL